MSAAQILIPFMKEDKRQQYQHTVTQFRVTVWLPTLSSF